MSDSRLDRSVAASARFAISPDAAWLRLVNDAAQYLHFAVRGLGRNPGFTTAAALTIATAFGAGASTEISRRWARRSTSIAGRFRSSV